MNVTFNSGQTVGSGRYILNKQLSESGATWLAHDEVENKPVVLKFLPQELLQDPRGLEELRNQVTTARDLSHPNVGNIYDLYEAEGEESFISMEYVEGMNLPALQTMQPGRVFSWTFLAPLLKQIFAGLQYLHQNGIVQGSVKPSSLMLDRKGQIKLLDVGVASVLNNPLYSGPPKSGPGGLLPYLSPQQIEGATPNVTDDVYSLGVTIYELLTSTPPFYTGDLLPQIRSSTAEGVEQRLSKLKITNRIPPIVTSMVTACLSKDPGTRPQDVETIAKSLEFAEIGDQEPPRASASKNAESVAAEPARPARTAASGKKKSPVGLIAVVAVVLLLIGGAAAFFLTREKSEDQQTSQTTTPSKPSESTKPNTQQATTPEPPPVALSPAEEAKQERQAWEASDIARLSARGKKGGTSVPAPAPTTQKSSGARPAEAVKSGPKEPETGFVELFNGEDLTGWAGDAKHWTVQGGTIVGKASAESSEANYSCLVWQGGQVDDFELRFEYSVKLGAKSPPQPAATIEYRGKKVKDFDVRGYQYFLTFPGDNTGFLTSRGREGLISFTQKIVAEAFSGTDRLTKVADLDVTPSSIVSLVRKEDWNDGTIVCQGNHLVHSINGRVVADLTDNNQAKLKPSGLLALGVNTATKPGAIVQFRNIRLKKLSK